MWSCNCFPHVVKCQPSHYNRANSVIIKKAIILNMTHKSCHMYSVKENGEMMLKVTPENHFAKLGVVVQDCFFYM